MSKRKWFYDTIDDGNRRLRNSIVMFGGTPVVIGNIVGMNTDQVAAFYRLPMKNPVEELAPFTPNNFSIKNLPSLGYVDYKGWSHYLSRTPSRQNVQGYSRHNTVVQQNPDGSTPNLDHLHSLLSLVDMFQNRYRKFSDVLDEVISFESPIKRAISKTCALSVDDMETIDLEHRGLKVARNNNPKKYGNLFRLPKKFHYLREELEESGIKIEA